MRDWCCQGFIVEVLKEGRRGRGDGWRGCGSGRRRVHGGEVVGRAAKVRRGGRGPWEEYIGYD